MKISERTISALARVVTGDSHVSPYNSGSDLVRFFNEIGSNDIYGAGFPSRWRYAEDKIRELNGTTQLVQVFQSVLDPRNFIGTQFSFEVAAGHLNQYLKYDGYELSKYGEMYRIREIDGALVELETRFQESKEVSHQFIDEQIKKCDRKIFEGDLGGGAITNARSLLEAVLLDVERNLGTSAISYDGDLVKLYRRVQGLLNLDPSRKDVSDTLRQVLGGLASVVTEIAGLRNKMSDAHAASYVPSKHHARLAVNASKTLANFVLEVFMEQTDKMRDTKQSSPEARVE